MKGPHKRTKRGSFRGRPFKGAERRAVSPDSAIAEPLEELPLDEDGIEDMPPLKQKTKAGLPSRQVLLNVIRRTRLAAEFAPRLVQANAEATASRWKGVTKEFAGDVADKLFSDRKVTLREQDRVRAWLRDPARSQMPGTWPADRSAEDSDAFDATRERLLAGMPAAEREQALVEKAERVRRRQRRSDKLAHFQEKSRKLKQL